MASLIIIHINNWAHSSGLLAIWPQSASEPASRKYWRGVGTWDLCSAGSWGSGFLWLYCPKGSWPIVQGQEEAEMQFQLGGDGRDWWQGQWAVSKCVLFHYFLFFCNLPFYITFASSSSSIFNFISIIVLFLANNIMVKSQHHIALFWGELLLLNNIT